MLDLCVLLAVLCLGSSNMNFGPLMSLLRLKTGFRANTVNNPPYFPTTVRELAEDAVFNCKVGLASQVSRMRIDTRLKLIHRDRHALLWLVLLASEMLDEDINDVHVFVSNHSDISHLVSLSQEVSKEHVKFNGDDDIAIDYQNEHMLSRRVPFVLRSGTKCSVTFSLTCPPTGREGWQVTGPVSDGMGGPNGARTSPQVSSPSSLMVERRPSSDKKRRGRKTLEQKADEERAELARRRLRDHSLVLIDRPDNINTEEQTGTFLESVENICFSAALDSVPVVLINPNLIATAWTSLGPQPPFLLSDFAQVYFCCDDYFRLIKKDEWCGLVQRASSGLDLFVLRGLSTRALAPSSYERVETWEDGLPDNIRASLSDLLRRDDNFPLRDVVHEMRQQEHRQVGIRPRIESK